MMWTLTRYHETAEYTLGKLPLSDERLLHTLELPWRQNQRNVSRIPAGRYKLRYEGGELLRLRMRGPGLGDSNFSWEEDPARFNCDLHVANYVTQIQGCIAVGYGTGRDGMEPVMIHNSRNAMEDFVAEVRAAEHPELLIVDRF